jgi:hypothetical protein
LHSYGGKTALWNVGFQVLVVVTHIAPKKFEPRFKVFLEAGTQVDCKPAVMINDIYIPERFREGLIAKEIQFNETRESQV